MKITAFFTMATLCLWIAPGCSRTPVLVPDPALSLRDTAKVGVNMVKGVYVAVSGDHWKGDERVREHVTLLKVMISNNHGALIKIAYGLFSLRDTSGILYSALPPYALEGSIQEYRSQYTCSGFYVAPHYSPFYPHMREYLDPFYYDPLYYGHYYNCWRETDLPTPEMLNKALPDGVLENNANASGFLYFQKIGEADRYNFIMELVDAETGKKFGTVCIPLIKKD
jgi:hypothetical protein